MKYNDKNQPYICMQTNSTCYKATKPMKILGVLFHSTGANNPKLSRYVQPSDNSPTRQQDIAKLGANPARNDWNHIETKAGLNAWIGKFADGSVGAVQTMPWDYRPWGCGSGNRGSCNNGWIQFEICEGDLNNREYFNAVYKEAVELTAYLCKKFDLNPLGTTTLNGIAVPVITCHNDAYKLGLGTGHADINHWFPRYGKDMTTVRKDVAELLNGGHSGVTASKPTVSKPVKEQVTGSVDEVNVNPFPEPKASLKKGSTGSNVKWVQWELREAGYTKKFQYNKRRYSPVQIDGDFGEITDAAVRSFQKKHKLGIDGVVGPATKQAFINLGKEEID